MKKMILAIVGVLLCIAIGVSCYMLGIHSSSGYMPSFRIIGDIDEEIVVKSLDDMAVTEFTYHDTKIKGVAVHTLIDQSVVLDSDSNLLIVGVDDFAAEISYVSAVESYITYSEENGWEILNLNHPPSCNIKQIKEIVVVSNKEKSNHVFSIFTEHENLYTKTVGQMYVEPITSYYSLEGTSTVNDNFVSVYLPHKMFDLQAFMDERNVEDAHRTSGLLFLADGSITQVPLDGYVEMDGCEVNYVSYNSEYAYYDVMGIYLGDPVGYLGDVYYDMEYYLQADKNVMLLYVDGFSYEMYEKSLDMGIIPNMAMGDVRKVVTVHKSVTNAGFATMITGQTPNINGVYSRDERALLVPSIFAVAKELDIPTAFLEASTQILDTEIKPTLCVNGDVKILEDTQKAIEDGAQFIFTHVHELDEMGHSYGPYDQKLYDYLEQFDIALGKMLETFDGKIYITSDHGMHETEDGGDHGSMRYEDMIVPIIQINTKE